MSESSLTDHACLRESIARTEGVDPADVSGTTEAEMRASAQAYNVRVASAVANAVAAAGPPVSAAAAPASMVTASEVVEGGGSIRSRSDLANMSRQERIDAYKDGMLDDLIAGR